MLILTQVYFYIYPSNNNIKFPQIKMIIMKHGVI